MESLKAGDLKPGMVLKDSQKNVYLVVSRPSGESKLLMLGASNESPMLVSPSKVDKWHNIELSQDRLDWNHFRDALLGWEFFRAYDSSLTLNQINKIFGMDVSLEDLLKDKRKKSAV